MTTEEIHTERLARFLRRLQAGLAEHTRTADAAPRSTPTPIPDDDIPDLDEDEEVTDLHAFPRRWLPRTDETMPAQSWVTPIASAHMSLAYDATDTEEEPSEHHLRRFPAPVANRPPEEPPPEADTAVAPRPRAASAASFFQSLAWADPKDGESR